MKANYKVVTLREQVNSFIKSKILSGEIKPGEKINEIELSEELGTSRGPVREALRQLEQEGLVSYEANKGCTVTKLTVKEMYEMSLIRADLEMLAVNVCEGSYSDETIAKMEKCVEEIEKYDAQRKLGKVIEADQRFHELIVNEAKLSHLIRLWHSMDGTNIAIYSTLDSMDLLCWGKIGSNHKKLLDCIRMKEVDKIIRELEYHYIGCAEFVEKFLKQ